MFKKVQQNNWIFLLSAMQLSDVVECLIEENCKSSAASVFSVIRVHFVIEHQDGIFFLNIEKLVL